MNPGARSLFLHFFAGFILKNGGHILNYLNPLNSLITFRNKVH